MNEGESKDIPEPPRSGAVDEYSSPAAFARLAERFEALRTLPSGERAAALSALADADPGITTALRALLAQHDDDPDELASPEQLFAPDDVADALRQAGSAPATPRARRSAIMRGRELTGAQSARRRAAGAAQTDQAGGSRAG